jgi:orotidine-5'-phosphate decarboxylase
MEERDHLAVALDTSDWDTFQGWCEFFGPRVGVLKVGLEAYTRLGPRSVEVARQHGRRVFLDGKLHDIPNTVAGAVASLRDQGVDLLTLHASGGPEMIKAAREAAGRELALLGVTLLTHLDDEALAALDLPGAAEDRVLRWARLAAENGCSGAVCSPREVGVLRAALEPPFVLVTPGIRPSGASADDQRRTATPASALAAGADLLVIGRPLTRAVDPGKALDEILAELAGSVQRA